MENINSISPILRDESLIQNIGKYNQIEQRLIYPIGVSYDIYQSIPIKKESITPKGLLDFINKNREIKRTGELENFISLQGSFERNTESIDLGYQKIQAQKYSFIEGKGYNDPKDKNWLSMGIEASIGFTLGDNLGLDLSGNGLEVVSSSLEASTSLIGRLTEVALGDSNISTVGVKILAGQFANSVTQKTRMLKGVQDFFKKPVGFYNAVDTLELDKLTNAKIPGFAQDLLPMYFYTEIRNDNFNGLEHSWVNKGGIISSTTKVSDDELYHHKDISDGIYGNPIQIDDLKITKTSLLSKTKQLFQSGKIETMITDTMRYSNDIPGGTLSESRISRGRNLSVKGIDDVGCRVWTVNNQYNRLSSLIRPFSDDKNNTLKKNLERVRPNADSTANLNTLGVLQPNGFVKISPDKDDDFKSKYKPKNYMFSIENLAWKDSIDSLISDTSQEGPEGGRIMWFPPYDISFNETTSVNWNAENFIGRGEPVYTYVNTERGGTLNFKIIVDHPSIINYYNQKDPHNVQIREDDYLRFFAGCDVVNLEEINNEPPNEIVKKPKSPPKNEPTTKKFKIYFPNIFSGYGKDPIDVIDYLYKGRGLALTGGTGYEMISGDWMGLNRSGDTIGSTGYGYLTDVLLTSMTTGDTKSFGLNSKADSDYSFKEVYELIDTPLVTPSEDYLNKQAKINYINASIDFFDADIKKIDAFNEYNLDVTTIPQPSPTIDDTLSGLNDANISYNEAEIVEFNASKEDNKRNGLIGMQSSLIITTGENGVKKSADMDSEMKIVSPKWNDYLSARKVVYDNLDICSKIIAKITNPLNPITNPSDDYTMLVSQYSNARDTYLSSLNSESINGYNTKMSELINSLDEYISTSKNDTLNDFVQLLKDATSIGIIGCASHQGTTDINVKLSNNRATTVKNWLKNYNTDDSIYQLSSAYIAGGETLSGNANTKDIKSERYVIVEITTEPAGVELNKLASDNELTLINQTANTTATTNKALRVKKSMYGYYYDSKNPNDDSNKTMNDESKFFEKLGESSDGKFIFDKLSEKIKYFHPAFHSTTPEGFNSRLTFLHQCTRQGPTMAATDIKNEKRSATNMSFGRPPICVLRIGDFYDTKVIFESLNIDFDPLVWDLNQEGIGVQPMIATISMNFKFIGGSDLTGPIARLQNAVTFNFFANTGVYDDRNDRYSSNSDKMKQSAKDVGGSYTKQYDTLYNPGIYDSKTTSETTTSVDLTTGADSTVNPADIAKTVGNPVNIVKTVAKANGKSTETALNKSEKKEPITWITSLYTYTLNVSGPEKWITAVNKKGVSVLPIYKSAYMTNQQLLDLAKANLNDNLPS